jgi:hypothetical protein
MTTTCILAPDDQGGLRLYWKCGPGPLRGGACIQRPDDLREPLQELPEPRTVVLCGRRLADSVAEAVLDIADLVVVPNTWLRYLPTRNPAGRAGLAVRLADAHAHGPIERRFRDPAFCPF